MSFEARLFASSDGILGSLLLRISIICAYNRLFKEECI